MGKLILILLLALGAGLYFPQTRGVIMEFVAPALNPLLAWQTRGEMEQIARELQNLNRQGDPLPAEGEEFGHWVARRFQGGSSLDAWGHSYSLKIWPDSVGIISSGPDAQVRTGDDILHTARIQRQRRR